MPDSKKSQQKQPSLKCIYGTVTEIIVTLDGWYRLEITDEACKKHEYKLLSPGLLEGKVVDIKTRKGYFQIANNEFGIGIIDFILN